MQCDDTQYYTYTYDILSHAVSHKHIVCNLYIINIETAFMEYILCTDHFSWCEAFVFDV